MFYEEVERLFFEDRFKRCNCCCDKWTGHELRLLKEGAMARKKKMCDEAWTLTMATLSIPRMEVMLVAGAHPPGRPTDCKYAGRAWDTVTERLIDAVLFAFNQEWSGVAWGAAHHVRHGLGEEWVPFIMRVLVEGIPDSPSAVTPCWTLEGSEPVEVQYPWDRKEQ